MDSQVKNLEEDISTNPKQNSLPGPYIIPKADANYSLPPS